MRIQKSRFLPLVTPVLLAVLGGCAAAPTCPAATAASAEPAPTDEAALQVLNAYFAALKQSDAAGMASQLSPDALGAFHQLFTTALDQQGATNFEPVAQLFEGVTSKEQLNAMAPAAMFASFMKAAVFSNPAMREMMASASQKVVGSVAEGDDTLHVISRISMSVAGQEVSTVESIIMVRTPDGWRLEMEADIMKAAKQMAAALAMQVQVEEQSNEEFVKELEAEAGAKDETAGE